MENVERITIIRGLMNEHRISRKTLSQMSGVLDNNISSYLSGRFTMTDRVFVKMFNAIDEFIQMGIVDVHYREPQPPKVNPYKNHKENLDWLRKTMDDERISSKLLSQHCNVSNSSIDNYYLGRTKFKEETFEELKRGIRYIIENQVTRTEIRRKKLDAIDPYILRNLRDFGNVYVHRTNFNQSVSNHLEERGIRVEAIKLEDGNYILEERK